MVRENGRDLWRFRLAINGSMYNGEPSYTKREAKASAASAALAEIGTPVRKPRHKMVVDSGLDIGGEEVGLDVGVEEVGLDVGVDEVGGLDVGVPEGVQEVVQPPLT